MSVFTNEDVITGDITVSAGVNVNNFPATQNVAVTNTPTVNIGTMPEVEIKNDAGNPLPVSGPLTDTQLRATPVPVSFSSAALTPTVTSVSVGSGVAVTLAAANSSRQRLIIFNESGTLYIKLGTGASSADYTYKASGSTTIEIDFAQTAAVTAIKGSGTSNVQVTSLA